MLRKSEKRIFSEKAFQQNLERERARSDRYGGMFSMLIFEMKSSNGKQPKLRTLVEIVLNRVRPTDEVGWFETTSLGVLLPSTTREGALKLADDICQMILAQNQHTPNFEVYTYPSEKVKKINKKSRNRFFRENECVIKGLSEIQKTDKSVGDCKRLALGLQPLFRKKWPVWKRGIDILGSLLGILILSPLFLIIAILIKFVSPGPILFKQRRIGYLGQPFTMLKFRTMEVNADKTIHEDHVTELIQNGKPLQKMDAEDTRIFPIGKFLRLTGIDELPQLINILLGQMSLVGPRPELPCSLKYCEPWHVRRFETKPGLSGLWQISGKTKTTFNEMMRLDINYIKKRSFWLDILIILKTVPTIFFEARR
jgi:lipopolysaccharide/colanic/teichoic acid biosynthesis glycosyltransferase